MNNHKKSLSKNMGQAHSVGFYRLLPHITAYYRILPHNVFFDKEARK